MKKIAFVFPGQGSQYVGMGHDLYQKYDLVRELFNQAGSILGYDFTKTMFSGPLETLTQTQYAQPAIFIVSVAISRLLEKQGILPAAVAGHSLGEYAALVVSGIMSFADGLKVVQIRGRLMQETAAKHPGTMAAIIGLDNNKVESICRNIKTGLVEPVNYNCPGQLVIAGQTEAVQEAVRTALTEGAPKAMLLQVSGPFHSTLMKEVSIRLEQELASISVENPTIPLVANYSARFIQNKEEARTAMLKQVYAPVLWEKSMQQLLQNGLELFIEAGSGRVLTGLMKRINRQAKVVNIENEETLQEFLAGI